MASRRGSPRSYSDAVRWLDSLQGSGIRPGLGRMKAALLAAENPHRAYPTVSVAGTNGKGSTAATLSSILHEAGYNVGLYTSPHLVDLRERWKIGSRYATEAELLQAIRELINASRLCGILPTYFEALTLIAFILFRHVDCDVAVMEVGLGGRLDATNVTRPILALISSVSIDHRGFLGNTVRGVAREKAGVIHRGTRAITSADHPDAISQIEKRAQDVGAELSQLDHDCTIDNVRSGSSDISFRLKTASSVYRLRSPLTGRFQSENIALAVRGAEELSGRFDRIDQKAIENGVSRTAWRGRLEKFDLGGYSAWVDGGHNEGAIDQLVRFIDRFIQPPRTLVFGIMRDKDIEFAVEQLFPRFDFVVLTLVDQERGFAPKDLARMARALDVECAVRSDLREAVRLGLRRRKNTMVCGSLYLAGAAIPILDRKSKRSDTMRARRTKP